MIKPAMNMVWLSYIGFIVVAQIEYSKGSCEIKSVTSGRSSYGNYYNEYGQSACCDYTHEILYDYVVCYSMSIDQDLKNVAAFPRTTPNRRNILPITIKYIYFIHSYLPIIYASSFNNFTTLIELYINGSSIEDLQPGAFNNLPTLEVLQLDQNNITKITRGVFNHLTNLITLNLTYNSIKIIEDNSFLGLTNLETLLLSYNNLKFISPDYFPGFKSLAFINLSHNKISNITRILDNDSSSQDIGIVVDLSFNDLKTVNFSDLPSETLRLYLNNNNISLITSTPLHYLTTISLSFNSILNPPPINKFVTDLNLSFNIIETLNTGLFTSNLLISLDLSYNFIQNLHKDIFDNLTNLELLNLQNNDLDYIPIGLFQALSSLRSLNMSGNKLTEFEYGTFFGLKNVSSLDISNNSLTYILESTFHPLIRLTELFIDHNLLTTIDSSDILQHLKLIKKVSLTNNPWICKSLLTIIKQFRDNNIIVEEGTNKKTTNVNGIACYNYNSLKKQLELTTPINNYNSSITDYNWDQFNNFFNEGFFNTSFYNFFKNNTNLDFANKLTNIFQKQIDQTLNYTLFQLVTNLRELEKEKNSKYEQSIPNLQPHSEKLSDSFEERVINNISKMQSNNFILFVIIVIILICLLAVATIKSFRNSLPCLTNKNEIVRVGTESSANLELI